MFVLPNPENGPQIRAHLVEQRVLRDMREFKLFHDEAIDRVVDTGITLRRSPGYESRYYEARHNLTDVVELKAGPTLGFGQLDEWSNDEWHMKVLYLVDGMTKNSTQYL